MTRIFVFIGVWLMGLFIGVIMFHNAMMPLKYLLIGAAMGLVYAIISDHLIFGCYIEPRQIDIEATNEVD